jgi:hypothetical protein
MAVTESETHSCSATRQPTQELEFIFLEEPQRWQRCLIQASL